MTKHRSTELCVIDHCTRFQYVLKYGYCNTHYSRFKRGRPLELPVRPYFTSDTAKPDRLDDYDGWREWMLTRTEAQGECLLMKDGHLIASSGYVSVKVNNKHTRAHRLMASAKYRRPLDDLDTIHHSCHNRACVNPDHLFEVTQYENTIEMFERQAYLKRINRLEAENKELRERLETMTHG